MEGVAALPLCCLAVRANCVFAALGVLHSVHGQKTLYNTPKTKSKLRWSPFVFFGRNQGNWVVGSNAFLFISLSVDRPTKQATPKAKTHNTTTSGRMQTTRGGNFEDSDCYSSQDLEEQRANKETHEYQEDYLQWILFIL